jgi:hypothetical protein
MDHITRLAAMALMKGMAGIPVQGGLVNMAARGREVACRFMGAAPGMAGEAVSRFHLLTGSQKNNQTTAARGCFSPTSSKL